MLGGVLLVAPLAGLPALFGWIDQKTEAFGIVRMLLDAGKDRLLHTNGHERQQLITAAHTVLILSSFFDAYEATGGKKLSRDHKIALAGAAPDPPVLVRLYKTSAPPPFVGGVAEGNAAVRAFLRDIAVELGVDQSIVTAALRIYEAGFRQLAVDVPEFGIWAELAEHATTRETVRNLHSGLGTVLGSQELALGRLERLLRQLVGEPGAVAVGARAVVAAANRLVLDEPIVPLDASRHVPAVQVPSVAEIHQTPKCRQIVYSAGARPADDSWWTKQPLIGDVDVFLAGYLAGEGSQTLPLLVLGHPGAGKSLLMKVLAARLPTESYTVVRVALRRVDAMAPIHTQIQQALDADTHGRVNWGGLVEESVATVRVVLLDGFDELLQTTARPQYLQDIAEFQQREAAFGRPIAVVVTSRTIVAEQARIPSRTVVLRLEEFGHPEISRWTELWNSSNREPIRAGDVRSLPAESALAHSGLTRQPLLLLMVAFYVADPTAPLLDANLTGSALYERLFDNFVQREVAKSSQSDANDAAEARLWRLTIAAFAIFNRGGQYVVDTDLGADLAVLDSSDTGRERPGDVRQLARKVAGEFFFVHAAEADARQEGEGRHSYEFLHATFGEYLIARHVVQVLLELSASDTGRRGTLDPDDEFYALLSHQPLAARRSILTFVEELLAARQERHLAVKRLLDRLIKGVRGRHGSARFAGYRPLPTDRLRDLAAYSVNLVTLRAYLEPVAIPKLIPEGENATHWWRSTVRSWRAGLDDAGWAAIVAALDVLPDDWLVVPRRGRSVPESEPEIGYAQLANDRSLELDIRIGAQIARSASHFTEGHFSETELAAWAVGSIVYADGIESPGEAFTQHVLEGIRRGVSAYPSLSRNNRRLLRLAFAANAEKLGAEADALARLNAALDVQLPG